VRVCVRRSMPGVCESWSQSLVVSLSDAVALLGACNCNCIDAMDSMYLELCVRPQVDPGPLLSASAVSLLYTIVVWTEPIPKPSTSPAHVFPRAGADPIGISVYSLTKDPTHISHRLICADVRMQSLCPQIPRLWVSLAGRNYPPVTR